MNEQLPLTDDSGEVRELSEQDLREFRSAAEMLPELVGPDVAAELLKPRGRPRAASRKAHVNIRLDAEIVEAFKATGRGWQTRLNDALREWLRTHSPAS